MAEKHPKFVFKLRNDSLPNKDDDIEEDCSPPIKRSDDQQTSIVLCDSDSSFGETWYEQQLDIMPHTVIKKIKVKPFKRLKSKFIGTSSTTVQNDRHTIFASKCVEKSVVPTSVALHNPYLTSENKAEIKSKQNMNNVISKETDYKEKRETTSAKVNENQVYSQTVPNLKLPQNGNGAIQFSHELNVAPDAPQDLDYTYEKCNIPLPVSNMSVENKSMSPQSDLATNLSQLVEERIKSKETKLKEENERLSKIYNDLKLKVQKATELHSYQEGRLTLVKLKQCQEMLYYYLGFKDYSFLNEMISKLSDYFDSHEEFSELQIEDQLTMTLMKLKRNFSMHDLAFRFRVSISEAFCTVYNVILGLHHIYYENDLKLRPFPTTISSVKSNLPDQFRNFPNCRVILECVTIGCENPNTHSESDLFTSAKFDPKIYVKGLVGISPTKRIIYASGLYEMATDNADMFADSGILDKLASGDLLIADKSFDIANYIPPTIELNEPKSCNKTLSSSEIRSLNAKARAFIGRTTMQQLRRFCILSRIPSFLNSSILQIFQLCSALVNCQLALNHSEPL